MNVFPAPNTDATGYDIFQEESLGRPRNQHLFRVDLHPTDNDTISVKGSTWHADTIGYHIAGGSSPWGLVRQHYEFTGDQLTVNYTKILKPSPRQRDVRRLLHRHGRRPHPRRRRTRRLQRQYRRPLRPRPVRPPVQPHQRHPQSHLRRHPHGLLRRVDRL